MAYKIEVNIASLPKGELVSVANNLAAVENGGSAEMDEETASLFKEQTGTTLGEAFKENKEIKVSVVKGGDD
jgi:hypothetical protein